MHYTNYNLDLQRINKVKQSTYHFAKPQTTAYIPPTIHTQTTQIPAKVKQSTYQTLHTQTTVYIPMHYTNYNLDQRINKVKQSTYHTLQNPKQQLTYHLQYIHKLLKYQPTLNKVHIRLCIPKQQFTFQCITQTTT
mmetsp:Transcript_37052/g.60369  ORF Transcript_37052/g.60369 Transcript_37052/m.60369 type:complete len:136 (-) Transcript_37052:125-532(-)